MSCRSTVYGMRDHGKARVEGSTRCRYLVGERGSELRSGAQPVSNARQILAMLRCRAAGDDEQFFTIALQVAAAEARQGHRTLAEGIRGAVEKARGHSGFGQTVAVPFVAPRGDLADLIELRNLSHRLDDVVLNVHRAARSTISSGSRRAGIGFASMERPRVSGSSSSARRDPARRNVLDR